MPALEEVAGMKARFAAVLALVVGLAYDSLP
jgi:hypothetical protein